MSDFGPADRALSAWRTLGGRAPTSVEPLGSGRRRKKALFRLLGADDGTAVMAKLCRGASARVEPVIYAELLPSLPVRALRCHGTAPDPEGTWLFLEDAGSQRLDPERAEHRELASRWLARMHGAAAQRAWAERLPDRGPSHYLEHLRAGRQQIRENFCNPAFGPEHRAVLDAVLRQFDRLEESWGEIESFSRAAPRTLVHGDFRPKNVHVSGTEGALELFAMDWETAGWGVPAPDLAPSRGFPQRSYVDLDVYAAEAGFHGTRAGRRMLERWAGLGNVFRQLAAVDWAAYGLAYDWPEQPIGRLAWYHDVLERALRESCWAT